MKRDWNADELAEHWTLLPGEKPLLANKSGPTRLGFAVLLKFFQHEGRFPRQRQEVPDIAVEYLARQVDVAAGEWAQLRLARPDHQVPPRPDPGVARLPGGHRGRRRGARGLALRTRPPPRPAARTIFTSEVLDRCRALHIEPPTPERIDRLVRSAVHAFEERLLRRHAASVCRRRPASVWKRCCCPNRLRPDGTQNRPEPGRAVLTGCSLIPVPPTWKASWRRSQSSTASELSALPRDLFDNATPKVLQTYRRDWPRKRPTKCGGTPTPLRLTLLAVFGHPARARNSRTPWWICS